MSKHYEDIYTQAYYDQYSVGNGHEGYENSKYTKDFLKNIAGRLQEDMKPKSVLDVGCAMGYLVEALRDFGVEAYGIDVSEYAVSKVREDMKPYCKASSALEDLPEGFPRHFDLVTTIEVAEHLYEEDSDLFFDHLCSWGDRVVFSSSDDDFDEPTHVNVQKIEYWTKKFAQRGFYRDFSCDLSYLTKHAVCFVKQEEPSPVALSEEYERLLRIAVDDQGELARQLEGQQELARQLEETQNQINTLKGIFERYQQEKEAKIDQLDRKGREAKRKLMKAQEELDLANHALQEFHSSIFWRMTKPLRVLVDLVKKGMKKFKFTRLIYKGMASVKDVGVKETYRRARKMTTRQNETALYVKRNALTETQREIEEKTKFQNPVKFSVIVPVYNCPEQFLREMIESVIDQTYPKWELCLADGSDQEHGYVETVCREYAQKDSRVKYQKLAKNLGISANTNAAIEMSTGEYISLFDHDDLLHPSALFQVMKVIEEQNADFIYTDECSFEGSLENPTFAHFKPDYAPDTLRSYNYICHLSVFKRELMDQVGLFSSECDGSQDYDMILRLTEKAKHIVHIPRVLYYWRVHADSVASNIGAKPYCLAAARKALQNHLERIGLKGTVKDSMIPTTYKIDYEIEGQPLISILIPNKDHIDDLKQCLESIFTLSTYQNFEIVIVENNSTELDTFKYYQELEKDSRIKVVTWDGPFNYSAINNYGAEFCSGEYILLLNNDIEVITPNWLEEMLMFAQRRDVGAVGARLLYPDDTLQHAGVILGIGGCAGHANKYISKLEPGYASRALIAQDLSACTAACLMVRKSVFDEVEGLDESFEVAFNDVDFCMRIREKGYLIVYTPYAELYHHESKSRGAEDSLEKQKRFKGEVLRLENRWGKTLVSDPYYNPNLTLESENFSIKFVE